MIPGGMSSSTLLYERLREATTGEERRAYFQLWRESMAWERERKRKWFLSERYYGKRYHKVNLRDVNTAWCGRPVPSNGLVVWVSWPEVPARHACGRCKADMMREYT